MLAELPGTISNAISAISVLVAGGGALLYLLKRAHLTGGQKFIALLIGLAVGVPSGGVLAAIVTAAIFLPACSSGCHIESEGSLWFIIAPFAIATGIAVIVAAQVADGRAEQP